jgi:hypothetical protein
MGKVDAPRSGTGKWTPRTGRPVGRVEVLREPATAAQLVRVFHRWGERPPELAAESLRQAVLLMEGVTLTPVVAGAGFAWVRLPDPTRERMPDEAEFAAITDAALRAAQVVRSALPPSRPLVVFGVDVYATCNRSDAERQVGQFAAVLPPDGGPPHLLPKRYPTTGEVSYLRLPKDADAPHPVCFTPHGPAAVLVCHDLNVYSPRGTATTTDKARAGWRAALRRRVKAVAPVLGLHLTHYVETTGSFRQAYSAWAADVGVPLVGVSGVPSTWRTSDVADLTASLLSGADEHPILDLCERPAE